MMIGFLFMKIIGAELMKKKKEKKKNLNFMKKIILN